MSVTIGSGWTPDWVRASEAERAQMEMYTDDFILGSDIIDRKRGEIERIVFGLAGLLRRLEWPKQDSPHSFQFRNGDFEWWVGVFTGKKTNVEITARSRVMGVGSEIYSSDTNGLEARDVELVRSQVPMLLHGLLAHVPDLGPAVRPFMAAAHNSRIVVPAPVGHDSTRDRHDM